jgi:hypothetical protein
VQDNRYRTWSAYGNQYWPAEYLIDRTGVIRHVHFGEGEYDQSEQAIRSLLGVTGPMTDIAAATPNLDDTPESYLGYNRLERYAGSKIVPNKLAEYRLPKRLPANELAYGGQWRVQGERIVAGKTARLQLHYGAKNVYLVLGGHGTVRVEGGRTVTVDAFRLYTLRSSPRFHNGVLDLRFTPGVQAYAFTFG